MKISYVTLGDIFPTFKEDLEMADNYSDCLLRLPLFYELTEGQIKKITTIIKDFYYNINK